MIIELPDPYAGGMITPAGDAHETVIHVYSGEYTKALFEALVAPVPQIKGQQELVITCCNGKQLTLAYKRQAENSTGFESQYSMYRCSECTGCPLRSRCSKADQVDTKQMRVCWDFVHMRRQSLENITSDKGILYRVNRSIQVEGAFGVLKQDWGFRRFLTRGNANVLAQLGLLAFAFNIKKLHAKRKNNRTGSQLFEVRIA